MHQVVQNNTLTIKRKNNYARASFHSALKKKTHLPHIALPFSSLPSLTSNWISILYFQNLFPFLFFFSPFPPSPHSHRSPFIILCVYICIIWREIALQQAWCIDSFCLLSETSKRSITKNFEVVEEEERNGRWQWTEVKDGSREEHGEAEI